jgi:RNA polymerase sigma-70 factor (sigma-E family)
MMTVMPKLRRERSRAEFERFVADCVEELLRTGYLIVWDLGEAEDLVQEALLRVARRWPRVRTMDHPAAYARRVLVNLALDDAPRQSRRRRELESAGGMPIDALADSGAVIEFGAHDTRSELLRVLASLPPRQRAVLVLRYLEDLTEAQTATTLGCSLGTVKSTASRGLERLRETFEAERIAAEPRDGQPIPEFKEQLR